MGEIIEKIKNIITPILEEDRVEMVDIIYCWEAGRQVLKILVDKEGGITLSECVRINEKISKALDEADIIEGHYLLEVDSPGIDRPFKTKRDYERAKGRLVRVILNETVSGKKEYVARLRDVKGDFIEIDVEKMGIIQIPFEKILKARQEVEFLNNNG